MTVVERALKLLGPEVAAQLDEDDIDLIPCERYTVNGEQCEWLLAGQLAQLLAIRAQSLGGDITSFTSEGTSVTLSQSDLWGAATALTKASPLADDEGTGLGVIEIGGTAQEQVNPYRFARYIEWDGDWPTVHSYRSPEI